MADTNGTALDQAADKLRDQIKSINREIFQELEPKIEEGRKAGRGVADLEEKVAKLSAEVAKHYDALNTRVDQNESLIKSGDGGAPKRPKPVYEMFIEKALKDDAAREQAVATGRTQAQFIKGCALDWTRKALVSTGSDAAGGLLADDLMVPGVFTQPRDRLTVLDLLRRTVSRNKVIHFVRMIPRTNSAATVAETTSTGSLVHKPEGTLTFEEDTVTMTTIAEWVPASRQVLLFSNRTQLQSLIESELRDDVREELEDQVTTGDGQTTNMSGLVTEADAYNRGYANIQGSNAPTEIDTIRRAKTQLELLNYTPTGIVLNPVDWEAIELNKDTQLRYILAASPQGANVPRLWGIPVATSNRFTEGKFLMGDFPRAAELFIGEDITIRITDSHLGFFTANLIVILAEMYAALAVYRPDALVYGGLLNANS